MVNFNYVYDNFLRIVSFSSIIGQNVIPKYNFTFDPNNGRVTRIKDFIFTYPRLNRETIRDSNMEIQRDRQSGGQLTDVAFRFNNYLKFTMKVTYDDMQRLKNWRRRVGTSDLKSYDYTYDRDGNLVSFDENGQTNFRYEYDENSNIVKTRHHSRETTYEVNSNNEIVSDGRASFIYDKDGFLIQRGSEVFEYNSRRQLIHAFEPSNYEIFYYYDAFGRLVVRNDVLDRDMMTQYFYGDVHHKERITHIYEHSTSQVYTLFYDNYGQLLAFHKGDEYYYVALDPLGTPIVILNTIGSVVKQLIYNPLGHIIQDLNRDFKFNIGFQGGIHDPTTNFIFLNGRVYDPISGRWTGPDYSSFLGNLDQIWDMPEATNHYAYKGVVNQKQLHELNKMTDIPSWLQELGYDMSSLIPTVDFKGQINAVPPERADGLMPVLSAFECAFTRDMSAVTAVSTVPTSTITISQSELKIKSFEPLPALFGKDIVLTPRSDDTIEVHFLENPNDNLALVALTLLNNSLLVDTQFTIHGRDVHYFVRESLGDAERDVEALGLSSASGRVIEGVNVTLHRYNDDASAQFVDFRLHGNHTVFNIRYGTSVAHERERVLRHAMQRAVQAAWLIERELAQSNKQSMYAWQPQQKQELISRGRVANVRTAFFRDVSLYPQLADDPKNIRFIPVR